MISKRRLRRSEERAAGGTPHRVSAVKERVKERATAAAAPRAPPPRSSAPPLRTYNSYKI